MEIFDKIYQEIYKYQSIVKQIKCSKHPMLDIIYFNTDIESKYFLACELCIVKEKFQPEQLLPFSVLKDPTRFNQEQFISSIKKHSNQYQVYQEIKEINFQEKKIKQKEILKDLRIQFNDLIDKIEEVEDKKLNMIELYLKRVQKWNEDFYQQITQVINEFQNSDDINNQYLQILINYEFESEQMLDLIERINKLNKNSLIDTCLKNLDTFQQEFNLHIQSQLDEISQNELATINLIFDEIKFSGIQQEQLLLQDFIKDNKSTIQENIIEIKCQNCDTKISKFNKRYHQMQLQKNNQKTIAFLFREKNPKNYQQKLELDLYPCSYKYLKELIRYQYEIKPNFVGCLIEYQIPNLVFTENQYTNINKFQQLHTSDEEESQNKLLLEIRIYHVKKLINQGEQIDYNNLEKTYRDWIIKKIPEKMTHKQLMISVYKELRLHFYSHQQVQNNIECAIELELDQDITADQAILEIQQFETIFSLYTSNGQKIQLIDEDIIFDQSQITENNFVILKLVIVDDDENTFLFNVYEDLIQEIKGKQYPINENFFIEYFIHNFKDKIKLEHKNLMKIFCQKCNKVGDCNIMEYYKNLNQDYLIINCKQIEAEFQNNKFQKLDLNSTEIQNIFLFEDKKYNLICCLAKDNLKKYHFIIRDSEQNEWYSYQSALKVVRKNEEVNQLKPQYLYYKLIQ